MHGIPTSAWQELCAKLIACTILFVFVLIIQLLQQVKSGNSYCFDKGDQTISLSYETLES